MDVDFSTESTVREAAGELRRKHDALEWDAKVSDLIQLEGYAQARYSPFKDRYSLAELIKQAGKRRPRALVSVKDHVILVADDIHAAREAFAKGHELGHSVLTWHKEILYVCDEHDLSASTQAQMEWEANTFAAEVLFPSALLAKVYNELPTSMETVLLLRDRTTASIESAGYAFATNHPGRCVLLVMEEKVNADRQPHLTVKNKAVSRTASKSPLGRLDRGQTFPAAHSFYLNSRGSSVTACEMTLVGMPQRYKVSLLNTQYRVMALISES